MTKRALRALLETTEAALRLGPDLTMADVKFNCQSLTGVPTKDRRLFLNEFQLGIGYDGAPVIVMGTEVADNCDVPEDLAWVCLLTTFILSDSPQAVVEGLSRPSSWWPKWERRGLPPSPWRPYHLQPNDLDQAQRGRGQRTWKVLAEVLTSNADRADADLRQGADPGLGDLCYQIDRSALPALRASRGSAPTAARLDWLEREVIPALRQTARVLIVHGYGEKFRDWLPGDKRLFEAFLGRAVDIQGRTVAGEWLWHDAFAGRTVIYCHALSSAIPAPYLEEVRQLVQRGLSATPPPSG